MGKGSTKKKRQLAEIAELEVQKRQGIFKIVLAFAIAIVVIALQQGFLFQGFEWANSVIALGAVWMTAAGMAWLAGVGARDYSRANKRIIQIRTGR